MHSLNKYVQVIAPVAIVDNTSWTTVEVDTKDWDHLTYVFNLGATDIAMAALAVTSSDVTASGHANVTGLIMGTSTDIDGATSVLPSATDDGSLVVFDIDLRGQKRFFDLTATGGDGAVGTYASCVAILSKGAISPVSEADHGAETFLRI